MVQMCALDLYNHTAPNKIRVQLHKNYINCFAKSAVYHVQIYNITSSKTWFNYEKFNSFSGFLFTINSRN